MPVDDRQPDITSLTLTLSKDDSGVYLRVLLMGGWFGVRWSFGYPDTVLEDTLLSWDEIAEAISPKFQAMLQPEADKLFPGEDIDVTDVYKDYETDEEDEAYHD
jgi:hypothetical protein